MGDIVVRAFAHKADENFLYTVGEPFPREGAKVVPDKELLAKLRQGRKDLGQPYIVDEDAEEVKVEELDVNKSTKAELIKAAEAKGLEVDETATKAVIFEAIQNAEGTPAPE